MSNIITYLLKIADKVITEDIAGATFKPIEESERRNLDRKFAK